MSVEKRAKIIDDAIAGSPNRLREKYFIKYNPDLYSEILSYAIDIDLPFKQKVWHWVNSEKDYIYCKECNLNRVSPKMNWREGYKDFCSNKCSSNNVRLRDKTKKTLLEKYGVEHYSKTNEYTIKVKKTSLEKWGVDNYAKTPDYVEKSKRTYMDRYGVDSYTKTIEFLKKSKSTCLEKYGVDSYIKTDEFKDRFKKTCLERYGFDHIYKSPLYRSSFNLCNDLNYLGYNDGLNLFRCENGHNFEITTDNYYGRYKNNISLCTICNPIGDTRLIKEEELYRFIRSVYNGEIIKSHRDTFEIDVYLPEINVGFEFNGLYYHSNKFKDKNYHIDKTNYFKEKNIRIIHIWEDDWDKKRSIVESQIKNIMNLNCNRIYARDCIVREIGDSGLVRDFLSINHIQGNDRSIKNIGLYYNEELVSLMTFNKSEGRKKMSNLEWNLSRFCNILNGNVIGGASKLLSHFIKIYNPDRIISYADKDWSVGNLYKRLKFECIGETNPDYKYVIDGVRKHKQNFTKSRLKIDSNLTESRYMSMNKINKIYDCGKMKFELLPIKNPL
jgi:hypothetical protein